MLINKSEIDAVCDLVMDLCGVYLDSSKSYLIESRLSTIVEKNGCKSYRDLVNAVRRTSDLGLKQDIVDAITTNETLFFRDDSPFKAFTNKALPEMIDSKQETPFPRRLRVWSAAASTGQEPYSIAMSMCELIPDVEDWDIQILGTDISDKAISKASRGRYDVSEVQRGMPQQFLDRYFQRNAEDWVVNDQIRSMVSFRKFNLMDSFATLGQFDFIFCRNVAIYFTPDARKSLFERLTQNLCKQGYLFVGASEIINNLGSQFVPQNHCGAVFYQPNMPQLV
jgi:chemotaxis protein methyltransferase CheR